MDICVPQSVRDGINTSSQEKALNYLYSSMADNVYKVDILNTMLKHSVAGDANRFTAAEVTDFMASGADVKR